MPFSKVSDFVKSFPAAKSLSPLQRKVALNVFNGAKEAGDDDRVAIAKAISAAKKSKSMGSQDFRRDGRKDGSSGETFRMLSLAGPIDPSDASLEEMEFEVCRTGEFYDQRYGVFKVDEDKLRRIKSNFDDGILGVDIALDVNHDPDKGAYAWIKSLEVRGNALWAKFHKFTEEGKRSFLDQVFRYFSVEFGPFDTVRDGKKVTVRDVLRGIALTNRPVIKSMRPTFLAEGIQEDKSQKTKDNMSVTAIKLFAENLKSRVKVSKDDTLALKSMVALLSEDEAAEVEEVVSEVEQKSEESVAEEKKAEDENKTEAKEEDAAEEVAKEAELSESTKLASENMKLAEEVKTLRAAELKRTVADRVGLLTLSEKNLTGFSSKLSTKVSDFVSGLTDGQFSEFRELVSGVSTVKREMLSEIGSDVVSETGDIDDVDAQLSEVSKKAAEYEKTGMTHLASIEKAQKEVFGAKR